MSSPGTAAGSGSPSNKAAKAELARLDKLPEGLLSSVLNHPQAELSLQDKLSIEACCKALRKALSSDAVPDLWETVTIPSSGEAIAKGMDQ